MALSLTTEQQASFTMEVVDGRGRPVDVEGDPVVVISDETVISVGPLVATGKGTFTGTIVAVAPTAADTTARVVITADADISENVNSVIGIIEDITVTLDERTNARMAKLTVDAPADKPV